MIQVIIGRLMGAAGEAAVKLAAKVAPQRELDVFTHRMHAKGRRWWHVDAYMGEPGWLFIEVGGGTLEIAWRTRKELSS